MVAVPAAVAPHRDEPQADYKNDPRFKKLQAFFSRRDCPAEEYAEAFLAAADRNALDWRLLPSLSYIESTGGKFLEYNNLFGWGSERFPTPTAGIHAVGYRLANSALYKDKDLDALLRTYNSTAGYGQMVKAVMRRIAPE